ncbi:phosphorylase [Phormidesmis priestleyi]
MNVIDQFSKMEVYLLILVPQGAEYQAVCRGLKRVVHPPQVVPIPVGVEPVTRFLQTWQPSQSEILVMGLCGSLTAQFGIGNIVLYHECVDLSGIVWPCDPSRFQKVAPIVRALTSDRILTSAAEKINLGKLHRSDVVDMEGAAILKGLSGAAISMLRVVSDDSKHDLPNLSGAIDSEGRLRSRTLAMGMIKQPIAATRLIRGSLKGLQVLQNMTASLF